MKSPDNGFTLLEILVVLVIISIMSGIVVLNISAPTYANFIANAKKIAATLSILQDQAVYTNSVITCDVEPQALNCQTYKNGEWNDLKVNKLISWGWPKNITIEQVLVNDIAIKQNERIKFIPGSGQVAISFQVTDGHYHAWIDGDLNGVFQVNN